VKVNAGNFAHKTWDVLRHCTKKICEQFHPMGGNPSYISHYKWKLFTSFRTVYDENTTSRRNTEQKQTWAYSFDLIVTKKREISLTFVLKKYELISWSSFGRFPQKCELFVKSACYLALLTARGFFSLSPPPFCIYKLSHIVVV
jgi:hypothetical protein